MRRINIKKGASLVELMIGITILTITGLWVVANFYSISIGVQNTRMKTLAINLAQEQIEYLKDKSYFAIIPTSSITYNNNFSPAIPYDPLYYPPENLNIAGKNFTRLTYIEKVMVSGSNLVSLPYDSLDTGLKRITVTVVWQIGNEWKKYSISNLVSNYQESSSGGFYGTVRDIYNNYVKDANVYSAQNPSNNDYTDTSGAYAFAVTPGSYTLRVYASGYYSATSTSTYYITAGQIINQNFTLTPVSSGSVSGLVYLNDRLVISQIVGSTKSPSNFDQEYVEIFNPTTYTWTVNGNIGLKFQRKADSDKKEIKITYINSYIPSGGFYLFANTATLTINGVNINADAIWSDLNTLSDFPYFATDKNIIPVKEDSGSEGCAAIELYRKSDEYILDQVGWDWNPGTPQTPPFYETDAIDQVIGLQRSEVYARIMSTSGFNSSYGPAYDSDNNNKDFTDIIPINISPSNSSSPTRNIISGRPAYGAIITANDGLSSSTAAWKATNPSGFSYATFTLVGVATGTWQVQISSGLFYLLVSSVSVLSTNYSTSIPNGITSPNWIVPGLNNLILSSTTDKGIIYGRVLDPNNNPLSNIKIAGEPEGEAITNSNGYYALIVPTGTYSVAANPSMYNPSYTSETRDNIVVNLGEFNSGNDFILSGAGQVLGYVCNYNTANPYPGVSVLSVDLNDNTVAETISGTDGKFYMRNISTGTYIIKPVLDTNQTSSPESISVSVTAGNKIFVGTFTITGAWGTIRGTATVGGMPIDTGVLIITTTGTIIGALPPDISTAVLSGIPYYMASTMADGTFKVDVRVSTASATYNLYGWYTTYSGDTPVITKKTVTGVSVTGGQTTWRNISW